MSIPLLDARGRVLLLSGAAGGVGQALCKLYLAAGGQVAALDTTKGPTRPGVASFVCDVADEAQVADAMASALKEFGRIDAFVHAAGIVGEGAITETAYADWRRVIEVNLSSAFLLARASYPALRETRGAAVLVGSSNGSNGGSALSGAAYAASKAALANLGRYLAKEWAPHVRVNTIAPGPVATPMLDRLGEAETAKLKDSMLTGRLIEADEAAGAIAFLLSDHAAAITGATLNQSGGLILD